ncbi:iron-containing alcohol dehydrogenase, partial [Candidatus Bathyarchaeota archaeon]|nr:iron-containing alcohol dehydrogenase [Candidatus Bathyarchaeota archaeon]
MSDFSEAERLLHEWKGANYLFGSGILNTVGETVKAFGETTLIVSNGSAWIKKSLESIEASLGKHNVSHGLALGSKPNTPLEDLYRISFQVALQKPASILALGSGSTIDACKAASILATYTPQETTQILGIKWTEAGKIDPYFGTGIVTKIRNATRKDIIPLVAVQTGAGSAAHLTK